MPHPDHSGEHGNTALSHRTTRCSHRFLDPPGDGFSLFNQPYCLETRELLHPIQGDLEILSVGSLLVSTNPRLAVHFDARVGDHVLTIRQVTITMIMIIDFDARVDDHVLTIRQVVMTKTMIVIVIIDDIDARVNDHMQQDRWRDRNILFVINPMPL